MLVGLRIHDNTIHDFYPFVKYNWGWHHDGIFVWGDMLDRVGVRDIEIYNNVFYGDMRPGATALLFMRYALSDVKIHNNVFASSSGIGLQLSLGSSPIDNVLIYNNTFAKIPGEERLSLKMVTATNTQMSSL